MSPRSDLSSEAALCQLPGSDARLQDLSGNSGFRWGWPGRFGACPALFHNNVAMLCDVHAVVRHLVLTEAVVLRFHREHSVLIRLKTRKNFELQL